MKAQNPFIYLRSEGGLLPSDLLKRLTDAKPDLDGVTPASYHLAEGERIGEAVSRNWARLRAAWTTFKTAREKLPDGDPAVGVTRDRWLLPLFQELGYGRLQTGRSLEAGEKLYAISHGWGRVPIHLTGFGVDLEKRTRAVVGASQASPHGLVQEYLNRSDASLWGFVANGRTLRILRDSASLTRQAYLEFDLEGMLEGEAYSDFTLLWLVAHQSRFEGERPEECWLERWAQDARKTGTRALDQLRQGVETAISDLGSGFLSHPANILLRDRLRNGKLTKDAYYQELLRTVYRLLFLFVCEDRDLLHPPVSGQDGARNAIVRRARERYARHYSTARLRRLAERMRGGHHGDLWASLRLVMQKLGADEGCSALDLPALGSFLWSTEATPNLDGSELSNASLLAAVRALAFSERERTLRPVDYRNLGSEELGSVYESLLELHPDVNLEAATFELASASGNERKTSGSYYTPTSLIQCLLDTALDPVIEETLAGKKKADEMEAALLALRVCDPACGSGHFLIAAAHRLARRLAQIRTGDEEPAPEATRTALRAVIGHCLYGVDQNPMAVELCKVSLWIESIDPGKPLSFLEHRIRCGNSLLGTTPALLARGIPDEAFTAITGDDKEVVTALRKQNRIERGGTERGGQTNFLHLLAAERGPGYLETRDRVTQLDQIDDSRIEGVRKKESAWKQLTGSLELSRARLQSDAWCAAFVWRKARGAPPAVTQQVLHLLRENPTEVPASTRDEIARLAGVFRFFHWQVEFPEVFALPERGTEPRNADAGWNGGFDVVLGNPPWEQIQLDAREFFAVRVPEIAAAAHMAARDRAIARLRDTDPVLHEDYLEATRLNEGVQHFVHNAGRFPLTSFGRLNTAPLFTELTRGLVTTHGRTGLIVPSGIATDSFNQYFFRDLIDRGSLRSLFDFENREALFPAVDSRMKFCLLTLAGAERPSSSGAEFAFFLHQTHQLTDPERRFVLTAEDLALLNPNTRTCPVFRTRRDAEITKAIYRRVPVLVNKSKGEEGNPWGFEGLLMFMMNTASGLFRTRGQLEGQGFRLEGNVFVRVGEAGDGDRAEARWLPLYEAKMVNHYDHRAADVVLSATAVVRQGQPDALSEAEHQDPTRLALPRSWVRESEVDTRLARGGRAGQVESRWNRGWLLGFRDITSSTNERTVIAVVLPRVGVGNKIPLIICPGRTPHELAALAGILTAFVYDFAARQKIGGTTLNFFLFEQLPVPSPDQIRRSCAWEPEITYLDWLVPRVLELVYTSTDVEPFARDLGYDGPPFLWDEERRKLLRAELDAALFHLYGLARVDVEHILDAFPIVRRGDEQRFGEYKTKRLILQAYDEIARAIAIDPQSPSATRSGAVDPSNSGLTAPATLGVVRSLVDGVPDRAT